MKLLAVLLYFYLTLSGTGMALMAEPAVFRGTGPGALTPMGNKLAFQAEKDGAWVLWLADGTPGGITPLQGTEGAGILASMDGRLFYTLSDARGPDQYGRGYGATTLMTTDGTAQGTVKLLEDWVPFYIPTVPQGIHQPDPAVLTFDILGNHGKFYIVKWKTGLNHFNPGSELYCYSAKNVEPALLMEPIGKYTTLAAVSRGRAYFTVDHMLWTSDGTRVGTVALGNTRELSSVSSWENPAPAGDVKMFVDEYLGIWETDGTQKGSVCLNRSLNTSPRQIYPLPAIGSKVFYFGAFDYGKTGLELFCGDDWLGRGAVLLKDINPGPVGSDITGITSTGNLVFFSANDGVHGREPWVSDGTPAGTRLLLDIRPGADSSLPGGFTALNGSIIFIANNGSGAALWTSNGTAKGTHMLTGVRPGAEIERDGKTLPRVNGAVFFVVGREEEIALLPGLDDSRSARATVIHRDLWRSDGTVRGTYPIGLWEKTILHKKEPVIEPRDDRHLYDVP